MGKTPEIPGYLAPPDVTYVLQHQVAQLLLRPPNSLSFPGSQPVSFSRKHIEENLFQEDYFVCEKSDGIRCLMYLTAENDEERVYLITRKNEYYWIPNLHFPLRDDMSRFHTGVLVDGELIVSTKSDGTDTLKYLTFDCLALDGKPLINRTLDKRIAYLKEGLDDPYKELWKRFPQDCKIFPFKVERKGMERSYGLPKVFNEIIPKLKHTSDGLIFTPRDSPYVFGTDEKILKWKPPIENTVDFVLSLEFAMYQDDEESYPIYDEKPTFNLLVWQGGKDHTYFDKLFVTDEEWAKLKSLNEPLDDRVVEAYKDDKNRWRYHRFRDDKETANHISTVDKVIESIQDSVSKEELLRACPTMRERWKERELGMTPHGQKRSHP